MSGRILNKATLDEVARGFRATFLSELGQAPRDWEQFTRIIPSQNAEEKFKFLSRQSGVHEWVGDREIRKLRAHGFAIENKKWANGLEVAAEDIEDDKLDLYADQIRDMADDFAQHKQELLVELLVNGFDASKGTAYDGQFFFDSDHQDYSGAASQSNVGTAALAGPAFEAARAAMSKLRKPNGKRARIRPTHIMVGPDLEATVETIFGQKELTGGGTNTLYKAVIPIIEPELADYPDMWFLFDLSKPLKPFALTDRRPVQFRAKVNPTDDDAFDRDVYKYGADARYNAGYYFWQVAWGSDGTT